MHIALQRTPAPVNCLEDLQSNLSSMLHDSILTITAAVAAAVAFINMISSIEKRIPQAGSAFFGL